MAENKKDNRSFLTSAIAGAAAIAGAYMAAKAISREMNKYQLKDKVVLITGGSRGMGLTLAREMASRGALLVICARSEDQLTLAKNELEQHGATVMALQTDITDHAQVQTMMEKVVAHYGRLDVLINNAGIIQVGPMEAMQIEDYEKAMDTHFKGPLYTINSALPYFKKQQEGKVVNITSIGGKVAVPHMLPYTASKFALVGLSEGMHAELKKDNITVTTVVPFLMRTGSPRNITVKGDHEKEYALFKTSASLPFVVKSPENAAKRIATAIEYGKPEVILSLSAKAATAVQGVAPGLVSEVMGLLNMLLPKNVAGGEISKKGYESESKLSQTPVASLSDTAAIVHNET